MTPRPTAPARRCADRLVRLADRGRGRSRRRYVAGGIGLAPLDPPHRRRPRRADHGSGPSGCISVLGPLATACSSRRPTPSPAGSTWRSPRSSTAPATTGSGGSDRDRLFDQAEWDGSRATAFLCGPERMMQATADDARTARRRARPGPGSRSSATWPAGSGPAGTVSAARSSSVATAPSSRWPTLDGEFGRGPVMDSHRCRSVRGRRAPPARSRSAPGSGS